MVKLVGLNQDLKNIANYNRLIHLMADTIKVSGSLFNCNSVVKVLVNKIFCEIWTIY